MASSNVAEQHGITIDKENHPKCEMSNEYTSLLLCVPAVTQVASYYMSLALQEARKSPPKPTNYCVGALLVQGATKTTPLAILAKGYTLECEGNTHAEQCCFIKLAEKLGCSVEHLGNHLTGDIVLYTTMEPCNQRSVGNTPCVDRILALKRPDGKQAIKTVVCGVSEPSDLVASNTGRARLEAAGIAFGVLPGMADEILAVAKAGHRPPKVNHDGSGSAAGSSRSNITS